MDINHPFWYEQRDLTPQHSFYNALGRHLLHRLRQAQRRPNEQKIRMFHFAEPSDDPTIDNTRMLEIFNQAENEWNEAVRNHAPQQQLTDIIDRARESLHREVWLVDRDMNSPVFKDDAQFPEDIRILDSGNNWDRFDRRIWHPVVGQFNTRPEADRYRMHDAVTMDRLTQHGIGALPVHDQGFINRDYDIMRIHDNGLKRYLMTPHDMRTQDRLNEIHEDTSWRMTLLDYLVSGVVADDVFNDHRYHRRHHHRLTHNIVPMQLHHPENGERFYEAYKWARSTLEGDQPRDGYDDVDDDDDDDGHVVGGSLPRAHMALQTPESKHASSLARRIALLNRRGRSSHATR